MEPGLLVVGADVSSNGNGNEVIIPLDSSNHNDDGTLSRPQENEIVHFPGRIYGLITEKNIYTPGRHAVKVLPLRRDQSIPDLKAKQQLPLLSAFSEGNMNIEIDLD